MDEQQQLQEEMEFLKEHRNQEGNFEAILQKAEEERQRTGEETYRQELSELLDKQADIYRKAKERGGTAWPEFEKFVSGFERAVAAGIPKEG